MLLQIEELTERQPGAIAVAVPVFQHLDDLHQTIGARKRQRPEQHAVDDAEHRCRRPDAERECQDADQCEAGIANQRADREAEIPNDRFHHSLLSTVAGSRRNARRPGIRHAANATVTSSTTAVPRITGSVPSTRVIATGTTRDTKTEPPIPISSPIAICHEAPRVTSHHT